MGVDFQRVMEERYKDKEIFYLILSGDKEFEQGGFTFMVVDEAVRPVFYEDLLSSVVDSMLDKVIKSGKKIVMVVGDNNGADHIAENYGNHKDYDVFKFIAHWDTVGKRAGYDRNEEMFFFIGRRPNKGAVLFWNGENLYTRNLIYQAYMFSTTVKVYNYVQKRWLSKDEIEAIQEEERKAQLQFNKA